MPNAVGSTSRGCAGCRSVGRRLSNQLVWAVCCFQGLLAERLGRDDRGATAAEYALIATLIAVAIVVAVRAVGARVVTMFTNVAGAF
jgi:pilus assembly protein Flp/PilA